MGYERESGVRFSKGYESWGQRWRERGRISSRNEVLVFVPNIPVNIDKYGLRGIFSRAGRVSDVYISAGRIRGSGERFGFVRFRSRYDAMRSIQMFNNAKIRECKVNVSMAKYAKGQKRSARTATKKHRQEKKSVTKV